ncbi:MAG: hypothetical protein ACRCVN_00495 [Spirochaetia bacterium]
MIKVTLSVSYLLCEQVRQLLAKFSIPLTFWQYARHNVLNFKTLGAKFFGKPTLVNERLEVFTIYLPPALEHSFYQQIIHSLDLISTGRGSIYSQHVQVYSHLNLSFKAIPFAEDSVDQFLSTKTHGISMIVGRGEAEHISYSVLKNGYLSPQISYADGMGIRNKMGLVRITIPQQKEILDLTTYYQDTALVIQLLKVAGRLDLPGKGLIYHYPINFARVDTKTQLATDFDMASKEQIITAIDRLMTNIDWRRKTPTSTHHEDKAHTNHELLCMIIYTPYKTGEKIIHGAMHAGLGGATMALQHSLVYENETMRTDIDYDMCIMIMPNKMLHPMMEEIGNNPSIEHAWIETYPIRID